MTWRERLQPASFKGVAFNVDGVDTEGGRRVAVHEYPLRDDPYTEDMGLKAKSFNIKAYAVGAEYFTPRDALLAALNSQGPGTLIHPTLGELAVQAQGYSLSWSGELGGYESITFNCVQHGPVPKPTVAVDTSTVSQHASNTALAQVGTGFIQTYNVAGLPNYLADDAIGKLGEFGQLANSVATTESIPTVMRFISRVSLFYAVGATIVNEVQAVLASLGSGDKASAARRLQVFNTYGNTWVPLGTDTPVRSRQAANSTALGELVKQSALLNRVGNTATTEWPSYDQATTERDVLVEELTAQMQTANDDLYLTLHRARTAMVADITVRAANLARIRTLRLAAQAPAMLVSYQQYGDISHEADLLTRNNVRHPGFMPAGVPLEMLVNG
jgi:prophage DNA circulation protein